MIQVNGIIAKVHFILIKRVYLSIFMQDTASYFWEKTEVIITDSNVTNLRWTRDGKSS